MAKHWVVKKTGKKRSIIGKNLIERLGIIEKKKRREFSADVFETDPSDRTVGFHTLQQRLNKLNLSPVILYNTILQSE